MYKIQQALRTAKLSILSNFLLAIIKGLAGIFGNSYALIADAIESTTDVVASIMVYFGLRYAKKPADENHPYGHGRIEPLITFFIALFLIGSAVIIIIIQSIHHIQTPHDAPASWTLYILGAIVIWKELSYQYVLKKSKETNSSSLKADAWHHRSDAITSIAAFIGISIAIYFGEGYETADDWAALFAAGFILYNSYLILRPALGEIMDEHTFDELAEKIKELAKGHKEIHLIEKCHIRKVGMQYYVDIHAWVDGELSVREGHRIAHEFQNLLKERIPQIGSVLIHIEPSE